MSFYNKVNTHENHFSQIISCPNLIDLKEGEGGRWGKIIVRKLEGNKAYLWNNEDILKTISTSKKLSISKLISHLT